MTITQDVIDKHVSSIKAKATPPIHRLRGTDTLGGPVPQYIDYPSATVASRVIHLLSALDPEKDASYDLLAYLLKDPDSDISRTIVGGLMFADSDGAVMPAEQDIDSVISCLLCLSDARLFTPALADIASGLNQVIITDMFKEALYRALSRGGELEPPNYGEILCRFTSVLVRALHQDDKHYAGAIAYQALHFLVQTAKSRVTK